MSMSVVHYSVGRKKKREPSYRRRKLLWKSLSMASMIIIIRLYVSLFSMFSFLSHTGSTVDGSSKFFKNSAAICSLDKILTEDRKTPNKMLFHFTASIFGIFLFFPIEIWSVEQTAVKILNISRLNSAHKSSRLHLMFSFSFLIQELPTRKPSKEAVLCWIGLLILKQPRPATFW